jgi:hypothetical protein
MRYKLKIDNDKKLVELTVTGAPPVPQDQISKSQGDATILLCSHYSATEHENEGGDPDIYENVMFPPPEGGSFTIYNSEAGEAENTYNQWTKKGTPEALKQVMQEWADTAKTPQITPEDVHIPILPA